MIKVTKYVCGGLSCSNDIHYFNSTTGDLFRFGFDSSVSAEVTKCLLDLGNFVSVITEVDKVSVKKVEFTTDPRNGMDSCKLECVIYTAHGKGKIIPPRITYERKMGMNYFTGERFVKIHSPNDIPEEVIKSVINLNEELARFVSKSAKNAQMELFSDAM